MTVHLGVCRIRGRCVPFVGFSGTLPKLTHHLRHCDDVSRIGDVVGSPRSTDVKEVPDCRRQLASQRWPAALDVYGIGDSRVRRQSSDCMIHIVAVRNQPRCTDDEVVGDQADKRVAGSARFAVRAEGSELSLFVGFAVKLTIKNVNARNVHKSDVVVRAHSSEFADTNNICVPCFVGTVVRFLAVDVCVRRRIDDDADG